MAVKLIRSRLGLSGASAIIKYLLFIFNVLFGMVGFAAVVSGAVYYVSEANWLGMTVLVVGVTTFLLSALGWIGAILENRALLLTFTAVLLAIFAAEIIGVVVLFEIMDSFVENLFTEAESNSTTSETVTAVIQQLFSCCGYNGESDWGNDIPTSCCNLSTINYTYTSSTNGTYTYNTTCTYYTSGCNTYIWDLVGKIGLGVGVLICVPMLEIVGATLALGLAGAIRTLGKLS